MRRLLVYVLVIAGGVFIASCMGPKTSLEEWMADLGISSGPLPGDSIGFDVRYSGTNAAGERLTHRDNPDSTVLKVIQTVRYGDPGFPEFYSARVRDRRGSKVHENLFFEWNGNSFGIGRTAGMMDLKRIVIDKPYFGENLSLSETLIMAVYEPFELSQEEAAAYRLASADADPAVLLALMLARADDYDCIWCGRQKVCAVNPVCP